MIAKPLKVYLHYNFTHIPNIIYKASSKVKYNTKAENKCIAMVTCSSKTFEQAWNQSMMMKCKGKTEH